MTAIASLGSSQVTSQIAQVQARLQAPVTTLTNQETGEKAQISAWGAIGGAVSSLAQALSGISDISSLNNRAVSSTATTIATATASLGAQTGTFDLTNITLAASQEIYSGLQSSAAATLSGGAGSLVIDLHGGKSETISVGSGSLTLNGVAAAVNKAAGGVKASVIGTSTGARLVLQSSGTGSAQAFTTSGTGALAQFDYAPGSAGTTEVLAQSARNANLAINGVPITSAGNTLGSAISGVTISLAGSGNALISVSSAPDKLSAAVSSVANSLNSAIAAIGKQIAFMPPSSANSSSTAKSGPLLGNFTATDLSSQLLSAVSGAVASGVSANDIGLTVGKGGAISFDATSFAAAFAQSPTAVQSLINQVYQTLDGITKSAIGSASASNTAKASTGAIGAQTASLQGEITSLNAQIAQITKSNNEQISILISQYTAAENLSASASITQAYLSVFTGSGSSKKG